MATQSPASVRGRLSDSGADPLPPPADEQQKLEPFQGNFAIRAQTFGRGGAFGLETSVPFTGPRFPNGYDVLQFHIVGPGARCISIQLVPFEGAGDPNSTATAQGAGEPPLPIALAPLLDQAARAKQAEPAPAAGAAECNVPEWSLVQVSRSGGRSVRGAGRGR